MRIEFAGSGTVVTFDLPERGPAQAIEIDSVRYPRAR
jgi:hypothetical protein